MKKSKIFPNFSKNHTCDMQISCDKGSPDGDYTVYSVKCPNCSTLLVLDEQYANKITLDSLLKDNCKLAKVLWGNQKVSHVEAGFDCADDYVCCIDCGEKWPRYRYFLFEILDIQIKGGSIQEYINKTKI